jgi:hypothetical protein
MKPRNNADGRGSDPKKESAARPDAMCSFLFFI